MYLIFKKNKFTFHKKDGMWYRQRNAPKAISLQLIFIVE